jgi:hypothetical protein
MYFAAKLPFAIKSEKSPIPHTPHIICCQYPVFRPYLIIGTELA